MKVWSGNRRWGESSPYVITAVFCLLIDTSERVSFYDDKILGLEDIEQTFQ